jgi:predicted unusual protein kinase regulating ubiquinone biosynthesis (AarF/ABC1/UbiB family)
LDWSLVGFLGERERVAMGQIMLAAFTLHAERIVAVLEDLDERKQVNRQALRKVVEGWLRRIRRGQFPGFAWLVGMLDEATQTARLRVAANLMLFRKSLLTLEGVIGELGADGFRIDHVVASEFLRHFGRELPERWFSRSASRAFAVRLSNADLAETLLSSPLAIPRFWLAESSELLDQSWASMNAPT